MPPRRKREREEGRSQPIIDDDGGQTWLLDHDNYLYVTPMPTTPGAPNLTDCDAEAEPHLQLHPPFKLFGRLCQPTRRVAFFRTEEGSKGYTYAHNTIPAIVMGPHMRCMLNYLNKMFSSHFNGILVNDYPNGKAGVKAHRDSESGVDMEAGVVAVSHGGSRVFRVTDKEGNVVLEWATGSREIMQMGGPTFQEDYKHEIVETAKPVTRRISYTLRVHRDEK